MQYTFQSLIILKIKIEIKNSFKLVAFLHWWCTICVILMLTVLYPSRGCLQSTLLCYHNRCANVRNIDLISVAKVFYACTSWIKDSRGNSIFPLKKRYRQKNFPFLPFFSRQIFPVIFSCLLILFPPFYHRQGNIPAFYEFLWYLLKMNFLYIFYEFLICVFMYYVYVCMYYMYYV